MKRGFHTSAAVTVLLGLPWLSASIMVVWLVTEVVMPDSVFRWVVLGVFLASGLLVFWPVAEAIIARAMFRVRAPTDREKRYLDSVWSPVATAAGVRPDRYRLWIEESDAVNAFAAAGHTVAVTRWALSSLPPHQLSAVLAHELGHHIGGHAWASLIMYWYSVPGRVVARALYRVYYWTLVVVGTIASAFDRTGLVGCTATILLRSFRFLTLVVLVGLALSVHPVLLALFAVPLVLAWFSRRGEKYADRIAAELGYGPALIEVFQSWIHQGRDTRVREQGMRAQLFASHPTCADRIRALEKRLDRTR